MLSAEELTVAFGGVLAVDGVGLHLDENEILGLVGPNGSGKSTILNALTGMVSGTGSLSIDGAPIRMGNAGVVRRAGVLRSFQTPQVLPELTCLENALLSHPDAGSIGLLGAWLTRPVTLRRERARWADAQAALERVGLSDVTDLPAGELAYGQQRLVEIARIMAGKPRIVLLDEPSAGLNSAETENLSELLKQIRADGVAILVVDHKIDFLDRLCDRLIVLQLGRVVAEGAPGAIWRDPKVVDAYLGRDRSASS